MKTIVLMILCAASAMAQERSTTVAPEIASVKDNIPVKKETFGAKMSRIKADGNSIGVVLQLEPVHVPSASSMITLSYRQPVDIPGEYMDESLRASGAEFVQELNQALGTTDIELIDITKIPYREVSVLGIPGRLDNWWATKYKLVFIFKVNPQLEPVRDNLDGKVKFSAVLNLINALIVAEYIGGPASKDQDILTQVNNLGTFRSPPFEQPDDILDVKIVYEKTIEMLKMPVLEKMRMTRADGVKKLVEKKLKP